MFQRICISLKIFLKGKGRKEGGRSRLEGREREEGRHTERWGDTNTPRPPGAAGTLRSLLREPRAVALLRGRASDPQLLPRTPAPRAQPFRKRKSHPAQVSEGYPTRPARTLLSGQSGGKMMPLGRRAPGGRGLEILLPPRPTSTLEGRVSLSFRLLIHRLPKGSVFPQVTRLPCKELAPTPGRPPGLGPPLPPGAEAALWIK